MRIKEVLSRFHRDDSGQDLVEYALLCALIALAAVFGMGELAESINRAFRLIGFRFANDPT